MSQPQGTKHRYTSAIADPEPLGLSQGQLPSCPTPSQGLVGVAQTQRLKFKATGHRACCGVFDFVVCCCLFWEADKTNFTAVENHANIVQEEAFSSLLLLHTTQIGPPEPARLSVF